jgi:hypothetical protein
VKLPNDTRKTDVPRVAEGHSISEISRPALHRGNRRGIPRRSDFRPPALTNPRTRREIRGLGHRREVARSRDFRHPTHPEAPTKFPRIARAATPRNDRCATLRDGSKEQVGGGRGEGTREVGGTRKVSFAEETRPRRVTVTARTLRVVPRSRPVRHAKPQ